MRWLKLLCLGLAKFSGLFWLSRALNRRALRILCYHGFALAREHEFRPKLFMDSEDFERRMAWLRRHGYRMVSLDDALDAFEQNRPVPNAVVITMDDGLVGIRERAVPILRKFGYPATVYVTSYYVEKQQPLFNLVVQYLFWTTGKQHVELAEGRLDWIGCCYLLRDSPSADRPAILRRLAAALDSDIEPLLRSRVFHLMSRDELTDIYRQGFDIQLHTHRHRWSLDDRAVNAREIADNRAVLDSIVGRPLCHFCYPAGQFTPKQYEWLASLGIKSATTLEPGLNHTGTPLLGLRRIIDGSNVTELEFEAEISGFMEAGRWLRDRASRIGFRPSASLSLVTGSADAQRGDA